MFKSWVYPAYVRAMRPRRPRKRRATDRGQLITTGAVLAAALGLNTDTSLVYQLFSLLLCLLIASRIALALHRPNVSVQRQLPRYATAGEPFDYQVTVTNLGDRVEGDLILAENPLIIPPHRHQFLNEKEPFEDTRNAYDRLIGFHRFIHLQRLNTGLTIVPQPVPEISRQGSVKVRMTAEPIRRGLVHLVSSSILHPDPLNLNHGVTRFENRESLLVLPRRYRVRRPPDLGGSRHFQPGGINAAWSIGESDEFVSLRDYRDGDSMRKIHWASSAKRTKPVVREYQDEYFVRYALVLDTSCQDSKVFEDAVSVAASYCIELNRDDAMLDLIYVEDRAEITTSGRGTSSVNSQLEALATVSAHTGSLEHLSETVIAHSRLISACVLVLCSYTTEHVNLIARLRAMGVHAEVLVVTADAALLDNPPRGIQVLRQGDIQKSLNRAQGSGES